MDLAFTPEQESLRAMLREFLADRSSEEAVRREMETDRGFDAEVWKQLGDDLGVLGLAIPERYGGSGYGFAEVGVVLEESGRALLCAPYFSSVVLATNTLMCCGDDAAKRDYLPRLASGELRGTLALTEDTGGWTAENVTLAAVPDGEYWRLSGHKSFVIDGQSADLILVVGRTEGGLGVFAVESGASGLTTTPMTTLDMTRKQARLEFDDVTARAIGGPSDEVWTGLSHVLDLAAVGISMEQVGGTAKVLEMSVEYAKVRHQFGRAIGSFQAIKHKCADMLVAVETARSAAYYAVWSAADEDDAQTALAASMAKAYCSEAYLKCAKDNIQVHGGIGFTWEHSAHLYLRRAKSTQLLLGDSSYHRELVAQLVGI